MRTLSPRKARRQRQSGIVMALALFAMATLTLVLAASLLVGSSDIRATRGYRGSTQAHFVAESGIAQALQTANKANGIGVVNYQNDVYNGWAVLYGTNSRNFAPLGGFTYTVVPLLNNANPTQAGWFVATALGPEGVKNVVSANVLRQNIPAAAPGAIYLATDQQTDATFNGNSFQIDGNDSNYTGGAGPGPAVPGIATRNAANTTETLTSLSSSQKADVTGQGFIAGNPPTPSVLTSATAPSVAQVDAIVNDILATVPANKLATFSGSPVNDSDLQSLGGWVKSGTPTPMVTHLTGAGMTKVNGNIMGSGILIVDGDLTLTGTMDFYGLIIVRGKTNIGETDLSGNANMWGSLWTNDIKLVVNGNAFAKYSTQALALANALLPAGVLPAPLRVNALVDCAEVPAGSNGCPA